MGKFLTKLDCAPLEDSDSIWVLSSPLVFQSDLVGEITAPTGFYTDLASVPRVPILYFFYGGRAHHEGVIHDLLFRKDAVDFIKFNEGIPKEVGFSLANRIFFEAMESRNKSFLVRYGMTTGVYIGGYFSFHKKNVMDKIEA